MARLYRRWTPEEERLLRDNLGLGYRGVAELLGRQVKVVQRKARQLGIDLRLKRRWTQCDLQFLLDNDHLPDREIAKALGTTRKCVSQARVRNCLPRKKAGRLEAQKVTWRCPGCGGVFLRTPGEARGRLYCSKKCGIRSRHKATHETRLCKTCAMSFEVCLSSLAGRKGSGSYCSSACRVAGTRRLATGLCAGCGESFQGVPCVVARKRFCSAECRSRSHKNRYLMRTGYVALRVGGKDVLEHRHVMEQHVGRPLLRSETVHHRNGDRSDNRLSNLELWSKQHGAGQRVSDVVEDAVRRLREAGVAAEEVAWRLSAQV